MITTKELQYVDDWAKKIPMPGIEYSSRVMQELELCYNLYNDIYKDKEYYFIFSDGEEIAFEVQAKNLGHMLGIDYTNIKGPFFKEYREKVLGIKSHEFSSYDLLEQILENADKVIENDNDITQNRKIINYYKSGVKCTIFRKMSSFEKFNFAAINYNGGDNKFDYSKEKKLFVPSNESVCPFFIMGISVDENSLSENNKYIPKYTVRTLYAARDPIKQFKDQEVVIPTQILISDSDKLTRINATAEEKIQLLTMYKNIINTYNLPNRLNIFGDYEVVLNDEANKTYFK